MIPPCSERKVRLSPGCRVLVRHDEVIVDTPETELRFDTVAASALGRLLEQLRRPCVPSRLVPEVHLKHTILEPVLRALLEEHLLLDEERFRYVTEVDDVSSGLLDEARFYARTIFSQPFWTDLLAGKLTIPQVLGWGVEFYHFVDAASTYMPLGVAHARVHRAQRGMLALHFVEEMNHGQIFLDGLQRAGLDPRSVQEAPPLPHTAALVNLLSEMAIEGEVTYSAAFAVMQPGLSPASKESVDSFYQELAKLYPPAQPMLEAFRVHAEIDVDLGHEETVFTHICRDGDGLSPEEICRARWAMRTLAESFILFFEGIRDSYAKCQAFFPRRALSIPNL